MWDRHVGPQVHARLAANEPGLAKTLKLRRAPTWSATGAGRLLAENYATGACADDAAGHGDPRSRWWLADFQRSRAR